MNKHASIYEIRQLKLFGPYAISAICTLAITMINTIIAGKFIGATALAAIELTTPILLIDEGLHEIFGTGIPRIISKLRVEKGKETADRAIAAILTAVCISYVVVVAGLLIFSRDIVGMFTDDPQLVDSALAYLRPTVAVMPLFEIFLCLEFAFTIDGRAKLFSMRPMITSVANILLSLAAVLVFHMGVFGIALATAASTLIGYSVILIHGASSRCTVRPDFSVVRHKDEMLSYIGMTVYIGKEYAVWELIFVFIGGAVNKAILVSGGVTGLAFWCVIQNVMTIAGTVSNSLNKSSNLVHSVLIGGEDFRTLKEIVKKTYVFAFALGCVICIVLCPIAVPLVKLFGIEAAEAAACAFYLRLALLSCPFKLLSDSACNFAVTVGKMWTIRIMNIFENITIIPMIYIMSSLGMTGIVLGYYSTVAFSVCYAAFMIKKGRLFPDYMDKEGALDSFYLTTDSRSISEASRHVTDFFLKEGCSRKFCMNAALLVEECCVRIKQENRGSDKITIYIRLRMIEDRYIMIICDNGATFNLVTSMESAHDKDIDQLENILIKKLSENMEYDRFLEMNYIKFSVQQSVLSE